MPNDAEILHALFDAALKAALPDGQFDGRLPLRPKGRTIVLGAGKASARMAAAFEEAWARVGGTCEGLVVTRYGHAVPTRAVAGTPPTASFIAPRCSRCCSRRQAGTRSSA